MREPVTGVAYTNTVSVGATKPCNSFTKVTRPLMLLAALWVAGRLAVAGLVLAGLTWRQSSAYADSETLYRRTLVTNPACWM